MMLFHHRKTSIIRRVGTMISSKNRGSTGWTSETALRVVKLDQFLEKSSYGFNNCTFIDLTYTQLIGSYHNKGCSVTCGGKFEG